MLRTLAHYWRVHLAVALGAAVATAVLAGALLVGDSVRGSLRDLTLDRLGRIDRALVGGRFFREALADELAGAGLAGTAPVIVVQGNASAPRSGRRASRVGIVGVDARFAALYDPGSGLEFDRREGETAPTTVLNETLARELAVGPGDAVLLNFPRASDIPRETLMGETDSDDVLGRIRLTVAAVIPDRGPGRFGLVPTQGIPQNAFVELKELQRALDLRGRANGLLVPRGQRDANHLLEQRVTLDDLGLTLAPGAGYVTLSSREFVLRPEVDAVLDSFAAEIGAPMMRIQSYLANTIALGDRVLPYSLVAALDSRPDEAWSRLTLRDGRPAAVPGKDEILLDEWAAADLVAGPGDTVTLRYYEVGADEALAERETTLRVAGVVRMTDLAADRTLTPRYPGIQNARDIASWDPPFPVDLGLIRKKDEDYWDEHGATPKAFVSEATGRELWTTRFGSTTAVRFGLPAGSDPTTLETRLRPALLGRLSPGALGLTFRPVRDEGLRAASGATDFSMLFVSFSFFIILSAALLVGLLFRLGVERRAGEIGLRLALGYRVRTVRGGLLREGLVLAAAGAVLGLAGGVGYAALMMAGLRTLWRPAVGSSELYLHVGAASLPLGFAISVLVVLASVALAVRKLVRIAPPRLLAGALTDSSRRRRGRWAPTLAIGGGVSGAGLLTWALATGAASDPGLAFGSGAALLVSGLAAFTIWCKTPGRGAFGHSTGLATLAAKNTAWNPGRSVLSAALVASASFVLVMVGASTAEEHEPNRRESGSGGFALVATADVPIYEELGSAVTAFRVLPGDDASCLNLYRPERPRILGAPERFVSRNAFTFRQHLDLPAGESNPWTLLERPLEPGVVPAVADFNSAMWILHVSLGQDLEIVNERGEPLRLRLVGLLARSVIQSEVLISEKSFLEQFPSQSGSAYFLIDASEDRADETARALEARLAPFGFDATTTHARLAGYKAVENTYIATFQALGALGLLLGTAGLGIVLLRNVIERRGELATLRAFGFRRSRLAAMVLVENAFLLFVGVGVGSIAAVVAVAPNLVAGHVAWAPLVVTLGAVWAVGMLSSVLAVRGTLRTPLLPALKAER